MATVDVGELRKEYTLQGLYRKDLCLDPFAEFKLWFEESVQTAGDREPNAMTLATASLEGAPSARVVLLKGFDEGGLVFFTNYKSRKAQQLAANPVAAVSFHWPWLERQIQIEGKVLQKTSREESEAYFNKRPIGSRFGAIGVRAELRDREPGSIRGSACVAQCEVSGRGTACTRFLGRISACSGTIRILAGSRKSVT